MLVQSSEYAGIRVDTREESRPAQGKVHVSCFMLIGLEQGRLVESRKFCAVRIAKNLNCAAKVRSVGR